MVVRAKRSPLLDLPKRLLIPVIVVAAFIGVTFVQYSSQVGQLLPYLIQQYEGGGNDIPPALSSSNIRRRRNCHTWDINTDEWWTHHPDWHVSFENDTHYCFSPISHSKKADLYRQLYQIQFAPTVNCSSVITKRMVSSGWGTDLTYVLDGILYALASQRPLQMWTYTWHYAVLHNRSACPSRDMFCYFLNLTHCPANPYDMARMRLSRNVSHFGIPNRWLIDYITRPQTWLRHASYQFAKERLRIHTAGSKVLVGASATTSNTNAFSKYDDYKLLNPFATTASTTTTTPGTTTTHESILSTTSSSSSISCVAMHVRRADVVLHRKRSRRYHAISEYIDALQQISHEQYPKMNPLIDPHHNSLNHQSTINSTTNTTTFLLLTDDANAIGEALVQYGQQYSWMYLDRPRHRGAEGGWENQVPSGDPRMEVVAILAEARILRQCATTLVYSISSLAYYFIGMLEEKYHPTVTSPSRAEDGGDSQVAPLPLLINLDVVQSRGNVRSKENQETKSISKVYLP